MDSRIQAGRQTDTETDGQPEYRQTDRYGDRQIDRQIRRQTDGQPEYRQADRQI